MAKYATTEVIFECWVCKINCAQREMWSAPERPSILRCPNCGDNILVRTSKNELKRAAVYYDVRGINRPPDFP